MATARTATEGNKNAPESGSGASFRGRSRWPPSVALAIHRTASKAGLQGHGPAIDLRFEPGGEPAAEVGQLPGIARDFREVHRLGGIPLQVIEFLCGQLEWESVGEGKGVAGRVDLGGW